MCVKSATYGSDLAGEFVPFALHARESLQLLIVQQTFEKAWNEFFDS